MAAEPSRAAPWAAAATTRRFSRRARQQAQTNQRANHGRGCGCKAGQRGPGPQRTGQGGQSRAQQQACAPGQQHLG